MSLLSVGGNLDERMGGTLLNNGNFTYVNNENSTNTARYDNHRRSVYLPVGAQYRFRFLSDVRLRRAACDEWQTR